MYVSVLGFEITNKHLYAFYLRLESMWKERERAKGQANDNPNSWLYFSYVDERT